MFLLGRRARSSKSCCLWHFPVLLPFKLDVPRLPRPIPPAGTQTVASCLFSWENCWLWLTRLAATCGDCVCGAVMNFLKKEKRKKQEMIEGDFLHPEPLPLCPPAPYGISAHHILSSTCNRRTCFAVAHQFISQIVARFLMVCFLSSWNQMRRYCFGRKWQ